MAKILIVDDEFDLVEGMEALLASHGYGVATALSGAEGLAAAQEHAPDLILLDVMMPQMGGIEVCRRLKAISALREVPVLLITALHGTSDKVAGLDAGADDFITKPFEQAELLAKVRAFLRTKSLRDELENSYNKLRELENLRDFLIHTIIHDLSGPLTAIQASLAFLQDDAESEKGEISREDARKFLRTASQNCEQMTQLTDAILEVNRLELDKPALKQAPVDLMHLARACLERMEPRRKQVNVAFLTRFPAALPPVPADEALLGRVLINLLTNSLKFTRPPGSITVCLREVPGEGQVECAIQDTGMGIPTENLEKIFDKFFQGRGSRRGFGLGLAFCKLAVEAHGGKIWAESETGAGSRFVFRLPMPPAGPDAGAGRA
ncbi:MAG: response regulator [Elusimicrobia bacterium]|nr:response regulator [Elusimicrobiota bacterium]